MFNPIKLTGDLDMFPKWTLISAVVLNLLWIPIVFSAILTPLLKLTGVLSISWLIAFVPAFIAVGFYIFIVAFGFFVIMKAVNKTLDRLG